MPSPGFVSGTNFRIFLTGTTTAGSTLSKTSVWHSQSCTLSFSVDAGESIITKDTGGGGGGGWAETLPRTKSAELTCNGLVRFDQSANIKELFEFFDEKKLVTWEFTSTSDGTSPQSGDIIYSGQAYITGLSTTAEADTESSFDVTFTVNGAVSQDVIGTLPTASLTGTAIATKTITLATAATADAGTIDRYIVTVTGPDANGNPAIVYFEDSPNDPDGDTITVPNTGKYTVMMVAGQTDGLLSAPAKIELTAT